jgi:hypothetical protein
MQVGLTYEITSRGERFGRVVEARTLVNHVIGQWVLDHEMTHSTSIQPQIELKPVSKLD